MPALDFKLIDNIIILPEIHLAITALILQTIAVFSKRFQAITAYIAVASMLFILYYINYFSHLFIGNIFDNMYQTYNATILIKSLILVTSCLCLLLYQASPQMPGFNIKSEYTTLMILAVLGLFITISAGHFLTLYLGLELHSLNLYLLVSFNRNSLKSAEAGLKYFVLGSLSSCLMLFGISLIYGFSGTLDFNVLKIIHYQSDILPIMVVGAYMIIASILFKLSIVPFHAWTADTYEGSPISTMTFLTSSAKIGSLYVLINLSTNVLHNYLLYYDVVLQIFAILSIIVGATAAVKQHSIKRLFGYSTILNIGYIVLALSSNSMIAIQAALIYMIIYAITIIGIFALLMMTFGEHMEHAVIDDLTGLSIEHKFVAILLAMLLFSLTGIPPFAGFFAKFYIITAIINAKIYFGTLISIICSVVAAYYYLKFVKNIYFSQYSTDAQQDRFTHLNRNCHINLVIITTIAVIVNLIFILQPDILPIITAIEHFR